MQLGIYSLGQRKNRIGYYLFHVLIGFMVLIATQLIYINYTVIQADHYIYFKSLELIVIALVGYIGNLLMLRDNKDKRKYIKQGLLPTGATVGAGIFIGTILRIV